MKLITGHDLAAQAANRWWLAYLAPFKNKPMSSIDADAVYRNLVALGPAPTPEQVNAVMPNTSWTQLYCNCCGEFVERAVNVDMTGGEYTTHLCEPCAKKICELFK